MIPTRPATHDDLQPMVDVLNPIILAGGTTAFQTPLSAAKMAALTLDRAEMISVFVALDASDQVAGFQYLMRFSEPGLGDIASFTRRDPPLKGAGRALFKATLEAARNAGLHAIQARIRADNMPGLGYYTALGFEDVHVEKAVPLSDGTPVDRVTKVLRL